MKQEAKAITGKTQTVEVPAVEKRKQSEVLPKSGSGSSSKSATSKSTDRKRPKQEKEASFSFHASLPPSTTTYCSPFKKNYSSSTEVSEKSTETSVKSSEIPEKSNESPKKSIGSSKKDKDTPKKPRTPSKCPYCPIIMTRTNDLRKHVEKRHQGPQEMLCHMCNFRCNDIVTYLAHENDHLCKCPYCGYMAKNYRGLPRHKAFCRMNPNYEDSTPSSGSSRREGQEKGRKE